jgi:hypothetical protein
MNQESLRRHKVHENSQNFEWLMRLFVTSNDPENLIDEFVGTFVDCVRPL